MLGKHVCIKRFAVCISVATSLTFAQVLPANTPLTGKPGGDPQRTRKLVASSAGKPFTVQIVDVDESLANLVSVPTALLDPKTVEYTFGRTISRNYLAVQVSFANNSPDYDFIVHHVEVVPERGKGTPILGLEKKVIQEVGIRGQYNDPRNRGHQILRGLAVIAVSIPTFMGLGPAFVPAVAAFSGPGIEAYASIFPDYTIRHVANVDALAYETNAVIGKQRAKQFVIFVPAELLLSDSELTEYRKSPHRLLASLSSAATLRIMGNFVKTVERVESGDK